MNMLPTTLDEAGSNRSNDLQVESGSYITLYKRETKQICQQTIFSTDLPFTTLQYLIHALTIIS